MIFKIKNNIFKIRSHLTGQPRAQPIQGWNCARLKKTGKKKPDMIWQVDPARSGQDPVANPLIFIFLLK
jgi:hypothetical protein